MMDSHAFLRISGMGGAYVGRSWLSIRRFVRGFVIFQNRIKK